MSLHALRTSRSTTHLSTFYVGHSFFHRPFVRISDHSSIEAAVDAAMLEWTRFNFFSFGPVVRITGASGMLIWVNGCFAKQSPIGWRERIPAELMGVT